MRKSSSRGNSLKTPQDFLRSTVKVRRTIREVLNYYESHGVRATAIAGQDRLRKQVIKKLQGHGGVDIQTADWDNLIILDACRHDIFDQVSELDGNLSAVISQGSNTREFIEQNWFDRNLKDTVCVTGNPYYARLSHRLSFRDILLVRDTNSAIEGHVTPTEVSEKALEAAEDYPNKRLVIHFMQPHTPFIFNDGTKLDPESSLRHFQDIVNTDIQPHNVRSLYVENLKYVLSNLEELFQGLPGKTVVTGDHGEFLGERFPDLYHYLHPNPPFRQYFENSIHDYGHCKSMRSPILVTVPWLEIPHESRKSITAGQSSSHLTVSENEIQEQLQALGYRS